MLFSGNRHNTILSYYIFVVRYFSSVEVMSNFKQSTYNILLLHDFLFAYRAEITRALEQIEKEDPKQFSQIEQDAAAQAVISNQDFISL